MGFDGLRLLVMLFRSSAIRRPAIVTARAIIFKNQGIVIT